MAKQTLTTAAIVLALAVGIGAFGAHGLKDLLAANGRAGTFETGVLYHFYHGMALFLVGLYTHLFPKQQRNQTIYWLLCSGILLFSGSLYALSISGIAWLGAITPVGGLAFIAAWLLLAYDILTNPTISIK